MARVSLWVPGGKGAGTQLCLEKGTFMIGYFPFFRYPVQEPPHSTFIFLCSADNAMSCHPVLSVNASPADAGWPYSSVPHRAARQGHVCMPQRK